MEANDVEGKQMFAHYLYSKGFKEVQTTAPFCHWDIEATLDDEIYYFELKKRSCEHTLYGDAIIQKEKYDNLHSLPNCYIVNIYTDDIMAIIPVGAPHREQHCYAQRTNNWDRTKVKKTLISYPLEDKYLRRI